MLPGATWASQCRNSGTDAARRTSEGRFSSLRRRGAGRLPSPGRLVRVGHPVRRVDHPCLFAISGIAQSPTGLRGRPVTRARCGGFVTARPWGGGRLPRRLGRPPPRFL